MDLYLGLFWQDPRFNLGLNQSLTLGGHFTDKFWLPDTFFVNSVQTNVHETILPNLKVWVNLNGGHMMLSARYYQFFIFWVYVLINHVRTAQGHQCLFRMKSTASCKMNLRKYPMDDQICHLALESCEWIFGLLYTSSLCSLCSSIDNILTRCDFHSMVKTQ